MTAKRRSCVTKKSVGTEDMSKAVLGLTILVATFGASAASSDCRDVQFNRKQLASPEVTVPEYRAQLQQELDAMPHDLLARCAAEAAQDARDKAKVHAELQAQEAAEAKADAHARAEAKRRAALPGARIGMTQKQVVEGTNWGKPHSVNRTTTAKGTFEQWVYGDRNYLYFTDGKVSGIQN